MNKTIIFLTILGVANILVGIYFSMIIFAMQGFYLLLLGIVYVIFGIGLLVKHYYKKLLFFGILPVTILVSVPIIMFGIDRDLPTYVQTPLKIGFLIICPFWLVTVADIFALKSIRRKQN